MGTTRKIAIGLGFASGAIVAAWLLTGSRKERTKNFISKKAVGLKKSFKTKTEKAENAEQRVSDYSDTFYI